MNRKLNRDILFLFQGITGKLCLFTKSAVALLAVVLVFYSSASAMPADSFSVNLDLKITGAIDLRSLNKPFAFTKAMLADTTARLLKSESQDFKSLTEMDSAWQFVSIRYTLLGEDWFQPIVFDYEQYQQYRLREDKIALFIEASMEALKPETSQAGGEMLTIEIPFKIKSKTFNKIFGGDRVRLRISGNINIEGGFRREDQAQVATISGQETDYSFHIDQTQRFKIKGEIGDKVSVEVDQDSERMFEFENALKLTYTGYEDEIIQKIEAGNIGLQLTGTQLATFSGQNKGLFGLKSVMQFGAFSLTTIASLEKGDKNKISIKGGAQETEVDIPVHMPSVGRYFFLGQQYREQYKEFTDAMVHIPGNNKVIDMNQFYVYKRNTSSYDEDQFYAYAVYDSIRDRTDPEVFYTREEIENLGLDTLSQSSDIEFQPSNFILLDQSQYSMDPQMGYIRLNAPVTSNDDVLAVAYATNDGTIFGDLNPTKGDTVVLKLIRPMNPLPTDQSWSMAWRNVYFLGGGSIEREGFSLKITYNPSGTTVMESIEVGGEQQSLLTLFGLDIKNSTGANQQDGIIDDNPALINYSYGELIFPDLQPFDPEGYLVHDIPLENIPWSLLDHENEFPDTLKFPSIYDSANVITTNFSIKAKLKSVMATYSLGFNVLENSEEIYLSGKKLRKGSDYTIDYYSGTLTILNQSALSPSANLEIVYESGELFQLDKKTLLGIRGEYQLWDQSFIGLTALYLNEKPLQDRVRIGNEPLRNFLWDVNSRLIFKPEFLTKAVDFIPLVETDAPSQFKFEMEYAQVHPNPNSLNNEATGDPNGVAYVDDFESIKKTSPMGIMRRQWRHSSYPGFTSAGRSRGTFVWFNPYDQVSIKEIWPNRPTNSSVAQRAHVLTCYFSPIEPDTTYPPTKEEELKSSWGGVMRALSAGYHNQDKAKYIEIMLRVKEKGTRRYNTPGKLHLDLGQISEDLIPNGKLDTEDVPFEGQTQGDGFCDQDEDTGIDGVSASDPNDYWDINSDGVQNDDEPPSMDDWSYDPSQPYNVWKINGTEGNWNDEGGRYPDTEDLDNDNFLDTQANLFRYTIDLSETVPGANYEMGPGGQWNPTPQHLVTAPNEDGWKMYRLPIESAEALGTPDLSQIQYVRLWFDGFAEQDTIEISIATLEIVSNVWEAVPMLDPLTQTGYEPVSVAVISTYDDPNYKAPKGVAGERDPVTDIISQEQSLVLKANQIADSSEGIVVRRLYENMDFLEYRKLKMFVHGGGTNSDSSEAAFNNDNEQVWMFFRFGSDTTRNYYEYKQRVYPEWDSRNEMEINLEQLPQLKRPDIADTIMVSNGDTLSVVGNPSLSQIKQFTVGIIPIGFDITEEQNIEVWLDELRVSDVKKDIGRKARASADLTLADLATLHVNMEVSDGDFHNVNTRSGSRRNSISGAATGSFRLDKFVNPKWGLSIPISGNFSQSEDVPYYFSNSDILVDNNNQQQVDTVKTYTQTFGGGFDISKNTPSASPYLKYTIDNLSGGYDYSHTERTDPTTLMSESESHSADVAYNLNFGRPSIGVLSWLKGVPVLKKYAGLRFYPLITKINLSISGTEQINDTRYRAGNQTASQTFFLTKTASSALRPFENMSFDVTRVHKSDLLMDPEYPKGIDDIISGDLGWDEDMDVSQTITASYNPTITSWLDTDVRYNTAYHWNWGQGYTQHAQNISNGSTITGSGTLKLTQIFTKPTREQAASGEAQTQPESPETQGETGDDKGSEPTGEEGEPDAGDPEGTPEQGEEGEPDDSLRVLPTIAKPTGQSALQDAWYVLRYTVSRLRDLKIDYTQQNNWSDPLVDGQAGVGYQLGLDSKDYSKIADEASYTGYSTRTRSDDYRFKSGLDFSRDFKVSLSYNYGWSQNDQGSSVSGSTSKSQMYFFKAGGDSIKVTELPIPDWTVTLSGLEKIPFFENIAKTVSLDNSYTGSKSSSWSETKSNIKQHDLTRNFSPLVGLNISWNGGVSTSIRYNWTESGTVALFPLPNVTHTVQKSAQVSASYTMKTGFKIPIPIWPFKNKRFKNSTTFALSYNYSKSQTEEDAEGDFIETNFTNTWSIKPSLEYSFSTTVSGGMHFEYGANKSKSQDSNYQEFGIRVNITIRG